MSKKTPDEILRERMEEFNEATVAFCEARRVLTETSGRLNAAAANLMTVVNLLRDIKEQKQ